MVGKAQGFVVGVPRHLLRAEGLAFAAASIVAFGINGAPWWLFALMILAPDISILFYLAGPRVGAFAYNAVHVYLGPILLFGAAAALGTPAGEAIALTWGAHIGLDRAFGFGLKYGAGFGFTHLGRQSPGR